jgi:hypothetical protein
MENTCEDFSIWMEPRPEGSGYRVKACFRSSEGRASVELPAAIENLAQELSETRSLVAVEEDGKPLRSPLKAWQIGDLLFRTLFAGEVRQLYDRACGCQSQTRCGLRIKLHFAADQSAALCSLPWELLYSADTKDYLGIVRQTPVVRYLEMLRPAEVPLFEPPLRILVAAANPRNTARLNLAEEHRLIGEAMEGASARVVVIKHANLESLHEALRKDSFHILHFMGHGTFDDATGSGALLLESPEGSEERVSGEVLANHLKNYLPQLVVVNACESAQTTTDRRHDFFSGVASALVLGGLPAVVAMRSSITDRAALAFSKALYRDLARGAPVDAAVAEGRLAIYRGDSSSFEWATPVLFMRVPDGRLFLAPPRPAAEPAPRRAMNTIRFSPTSEVRTRNANIANQRGAGTGTESVGAIEVEGRFTVDENLEIANQDDTD